MHAVRPGVEKSPKRITFLVTLGQHCRGRSYAGQEAAAISGRLVFSGDPLVEAKVHETMEVL